MKSVSVEEAREYYRGTDSAHDFDHVLRVLALAERIEAAEGADLEILRAAVLLHDIARGHEEEGIDHAQASAEKAKRILREKAWEEERIERVAEAILSHRFRAGPAPESLEAKILYDADKLDAIGAIGVARAYAVAGKRGQRLWAALDDVGEDLAQENATDHTPVHEFRKKLSKLVETLHTQMAKKIAAERHRFMEDFFRRLEAEARGEG